MPRPTSHHAKRMQDFQHAIIGHPHFEKAFVRVMSLIEEPTDSELAVVIGPIGVGKSTLRQYVKQAILEQHSVGMKINPRLLPVAEVSTPIPYTGELNWCEMYRRILSELDERACNLEGGLSGHPPGTSMCTGWHRMGLGEMRERVGAVCRSRGVRVLLIDDAQYIVRGANWRRLQRQAEILRELAKRTGTFVVLLGTYHLVRLLTFNTAGRRHFALVYFPQYRRDVPDEWRHFKKTVRMLRSKVTLQKSLNLVQSAEILHQGSAGCIGILKSWLTAACAHALRDHGVAITKAALESIRPPTSASSILIG